jgi:hypothetical protein
MNRRIAGFFVAVAAVLTSLVVLLRAEKPRRFLQTRFEQVRGALPRSKKARQMATHVSRLAGDVKGTAEQAVNKVKHSGGDLAEKARQLMPIGNRHEH